MLSLWWLLLLCRPASLGALAVFGCAQNVVQPISICLRQGRRDVLEFLRIVGQVVVTNFTIFVFHIQCAFSAQGRIRCWVGSVTYRRVWIIARICKRPLVLNQRAVSPILAGIFVSMQQTNQA